MKDVIPKGWNRELVNQLCIIVILRCSSVETPFTTVATIDVCRYVADVQQMAAVGGYEITPDELLRDLIQAPEVLIEDFKAKGLV